MWAEKAQDLGQYKTKKRTGQGLVDELLTMDRDNYYPTTANKQREAEAFLVPIIFLCLTKQNQI